VAEVRGSRTHRTTVPRRPTGFEGQESHRTLLTSKRFIIGNHGKQIWDSEKASSESDKKEKPIKATCSRTLPGPQRHDFIL